MCYNGKQLKKGTSNKIEEKYSKQSIDKFLFIKEEMLIKLKKDNVKH